MPQPNVVLITVECWRGDHFGAATPCIAQLARESIVFPDAYTAGGWTWVAMTALMSSTYASMHGAFLGLKTPKRKTLAECLLEEGYWTAGFTTNAVCGITAGFHRGFCDFHELRKKKPELPPGIETEEWERMAALGFPPGDVAGLCDAAILTNQACFWLKSRQNDEPFFLWLHYLDPHWPCLNPSGYSTPTELHDAWSDRHLFKTSVFPAQGRHDPGEHIRARWVNRYRAALRNADREIGRLINGLRARPDWERTMVVVTGDHGEEFFERGTWHHSWNQLYREGTQVPLVMRIPGIPSRQVSAPVGHLHIAPTILDFAGIRKPSAMQGGSLRPAIEDGRTSSGAIVTEMFGHDRSYMYRLALRDGEWKYIYDLENPHDSKLFNLISDPEERTNVRDREPEMFRRFERMRLAHVALGLTKIMQPLLPGAETRGDRPPIGTDFDEDVLHEQLAALGYL